MAPLLLAHRAACQTCCTLLHWAPREADPANDSAGNLVHIQQSARLSCCYGIQTHIRCLTGLGTPGCNSAKLLTLSAKSASHSTLDAKYSAVCVQS